MAKLPVNKTLIKARSHAKNNEIEDAQKLYQGVPQAFPMNKQAQQGLADLSKHNTLDTKRSPRQEIIEQLINLYNQGQLVAVFKKAKALTEQYPEAVLIWNILGAAAAQIGQSEQAITAFQNIITIQPNHADAHYNMGNALRDQGKLDESIASYNLALSVDPAYADAHYNMGNAFKDQGKLDESIASYCKALSVKPDFVQAYVNMGNALKDQGKLDEAKAAYKKALSIRPDFAEANYNMGRLHWLRQDFGTAFELMEWRWEAKLDANIGTKFKCVSPEWNGEDKAHVLVWNEQGIGDEIMLSSTLKELNSGNTKVIVECDKRLIPLYRRSFPKNMRFIGDRHDLNENEFSSQIAIGSLLNHFRQNLNDFKKSSLGWLKADCRKSAAFREQIKEQKHEKIIGISWFTKSTKASADRRNISMKLLSDCLQSVPATYVNLQYGVTADELLANSLKYGLNLNCIEGLDLFDDLDGLAALISACDTVISVDNVTVHLAGALGIDSRVLLPLTAEERWGLSSVDSYWYDSVTLYRQKTLADWDDPLQRLMIDLKNLYY